jgi:hypothetical protein
LLKDSNNTWPDELVFLTRSNQEAIDRILKRKHKRASALKNAEV